MQSFGEFLEYRYGVVPGEFGGKANKRNDPNLKYGYSVDNPIRDYIVGNNPVVSGEELQKLIDTLRKKLPKNLRKK